MAVLVGLGARWRDDPPRAGVARAINVAIRIGFARVLAAIAVFLGLVLLVGPVGNP